MLIAARRGNRLHAPENTRFALLSAWTTGAQALWLDVRLTGDGQLVTAADPTTERLTQRPGEVASMRLRELRADEYDISRGFPDEGGFHYRADGRPVRFEPFHELLDELPVDAPLIVNAADSSARTQELAGAVAGSLGERGRLNAAVTVAADGALREALRSAGARAFADGDGLGPEDQRALLDSADGLVTAHGDVVEAADSLTDLGRAIADKGAAAILRPSAPVPTASDLAAAGGHSVVHAVLTDSTLALEGMRRSRVHVETNFAGTIVNRRSFAFGYAKPHADTRVWQDDGVHVEVQPYPGHPDPADLSGLERRVLRLEQQMWTAIRDWPFYSGGGFGVTRGIDGDFVAEVAYTVERVAQATTLEMAVVNPDPGAHVEGSPLSPRQQDPFYDPHGCPPFVGAEHDEADGFRINWNLGHEYMNNQYGPPCGDGTALGGELRLERRGRYFSAYYRTPQTPGWICTGVARNDSLNERVFLRCAGKRWRQERPAADGGGDDNDGYYEIIPNRWRFGPLSVRLVGAVAAPDEEVAGT